MVEAIVKEQFEKEYEYKLDKRDKKPGLKEMQMNNYWKLVALNN